MSFDCSSVRKPDYAKWMLEDPRINFSLSSSERSTCINHIGLQADTTQELAEIQARLQGAGEDTIVQAEAECCYAKSTKTWVRDPDDVAWETFVTFDGISQHGDDQVLFAENSCCKTETDESFCRSGA
jgi:hypothetical protein